MAHPNVRVVAEIYSAWARDEFPGPSVLLDGEIEYVNPSDALEPGTRTGVAEFAHAIARLFEGWETWEMEPAEFTTEGDDVAVVIRYRARGRTSGAEVTGTESALWTIRSGRVVRYAWFHGEGDAAQAMRRRAEGV